MAITVGPQAYYDRLPPSPPPPPPEPPARSAQVPEGTSPKVKQAVDNVIDPAATPEQRTAAYEAVQDYHNRVGSSPGSRNMNVAELSVGAVSTLTEAGIPTRFRPEVVAAVDQTINHHGQINGFDLNAASAEQVLAAYQQVDAHVDALGGLNIHGVTETALPLLAERVMRENGIPTESSAGAVYVTEPLQNVENMDEGETVAALAESAQRLQEFTAGMDPAAAARTAELALPAFEQVLGGEQGLMRYINFPEGNLDSVALVEALARFSDSVAGSSSGDLVIDDFAGLLANAYGPGNSMLQMPLQENGVGLSLSLAIAGHGVRNGADTGTFPPLDPINEALDGYVDRTVSPAVQAYTEHTQELNWLLQNLGSGATPEQLQQATQAYIEANPGWAERRDELQAEVARVGGQLLSHIEALRDLPAGVGDHSADAEARIKALLENPSTGFAIATAAGTDPEMAAKLDLPELISFSATLGLGDNGQKVITSLANAHVQHNVLGSLATLDTTDPNALANARTQIATLRNPDVALALGLDPAQLGQLDSAVDELQRTLPQTGETLSQADIEARLNRLNTQLNQLSAFRNNQPLGQVFRGIGVAAGIASLAGAVGNFVNNPSFNNAVISLGHAAGLSAALGDLATGLGAIPEGSPWARFSTSAAVGRVLGTVGLALGVAGVVDSLGKGDLAQAGLGAVGVGGGALAIFGTTSWAGPVGLTIGLVAAAASFGLNIFRANQAEGELEDASRPFLQSLGFDETAAAVLSDFSGDGYSSVGLLMRYGELQGLSPQETVQWVNGIPEQELENLRDVLNYVADDLDGNYESFGTQTPDDARFDDETYAQLVEDNPGHLIAGSLPPASAPRLSVALEAMGIGVPA